MSTEAWRSLLVTEGEEGGEFFIFKEERTCFCSEPAYGEAASLSKEASRDPDSATPSRLYIARPLCSTALLPDDVPPDLTGVHRCRVYRQARQERT